MYKADWNLARKLKEYDPNLYLKWNVNREWFDLWYDMPGKGPKLLTSVTRNIYYDGTKREYVEPDERLIWWLYYADSHRWGGGKRVALEEDRRYKEFKKQQRIKLKQDFKDRTKDASRLMYNFYYGRKKAPNRTSLGKYPKFGSGIHTNQWVAPDLKTRKRTLVRSHKNAKQYNFKKVV